MNKAMDQGGAELILNALTIANASLGLALQVAQQVCSDEEFNEVRNGIAATIASVQLDAARPIVQRFPGLDPFGGR